MSPEPWRARRSIVAALAIALGLVAWIVVGLRQRPTQAMQGEPGADPGVPSSDETVRAALTPPTGADTGRASVDRTTRIEIVDERGAWLDGVTVSVHRAGEVERLGHSEEGVVSARLPASGTLVATCAASGP
jgi:hypothetical protein